MKQLPQHVSAVSPLGDALNGTGQDPIPYSVPHANGSSPAPTQPSPNWFCRVKGCARQFPRADAERITEHLRMHLAAAGPRSSVPLTVTPELCSWWLENTKRRRPISEGNWRRIWMSLKEDGWIFDGNPFGLDTEGNLIQGGHRAMAIAAAGMDVESALIGDLAPASALVMDTSRVQTFSDALKAAGTPASSEVAPVAHLLWRYEHGQLDPKLSWDKRIRPSHPQLMRFYEARDAEIRAALPVSRSIRRAAKFASQPGIAVAWIAISRVAGDEAKAFFDALALKGNHIPVHGGHDPVAAWHRKWARQTRHDRLRGEEQVALTIKCWNFFARGLPTRILVWYSIGTRAEPFPEPVRFSLAARDDDEVSA